jgi:hypothetical protein
MMARAWRAVGRLVVGAVGVGAGTAVAAVQFDRFENRYWHRNDPWRSRREDDGKHTEGDNFDDGTKHFGWSSDAEPGPHQGTPLLCPTAPGKRPRVVVLGTGWGARYFLDTIDTDAYEVVPQSPLPNPRAYAISTMQEL